MTYIVPPVWTACLRERFAGSTFVDVIEADVLGDPSAVVLYREGDASAR